MKLARLLGAALALAFLPAQAQARLQLWRREPSGAFISASLDAPMAVGSLQKPFVAEAWAASHAGRATPRFSCGPQSHCWLPAGHGELGLPRAIELSCNTYFRSLAADTPPAALAQAFGAAGFSRAPENPDAAIGLAGDAGPLIRPSQLLADYQRLVREAWPAGEPVRGELLAGLRSAALGGTAKGLGLRGYWAKTGTVPSSDGDPRHTCGLALVVDDAGFAILARLEPGTGHEAAAALAEPLARLRPGALRTRGTAKVAARPVTVRLFELLHARRWELRNLGAAPIPSGRGYLGPGATLRLEAGMEIGPGEAELRAPDSGARRRLQGRLLCRLGPGGGLRLLAVLEPREYVRGVLAAELPRGSAELREQLGAAVLRFLGQGPRHGDADVCDSTHCAWFVGRGPRLDWSDPRRATLAEDPDPGLDDAAWERIRALAQQPGPHQWTAHCGGEPLSPHALWGNGDRSVTPCPRHGAADAKPWVRDWPAAAVEKAFGGPVQSLEVRWIGGTWTLERRGAAGLRRYRYDEAHRALAAVLGWDAMPSPADRVEAAEGGFRAAGRGSGHRVGLCLAD